MSLNVGLVYADMILALCGIDPWFILLADTSARVLGIGTLGLPLILLFPVSLGMFMTFALPEAIMCVRRSVQVREQRIATVCLETQPD